MDGQVRNTRHITSFRSKFLFAAMILLLRCAIRHGPGKFLRTAMEALLLRGRRGAALPFQRREHTQCCDSWVVEACVFNTRFVILCRWLTCLLTT